MIIVYLLLFLILSCYCLSKLKDQMIDHINFNIVTSSIRPKNLKIIKKDIDKYITKYPNINFKWNIVYDEKKIKPGYKQFNEDYITELSIYDPRSGFGSAQNNLGFKYLNKPGWVYILDDDTKLIEAIPELINSNKLNTNRINTITCPQLGNGNSDIKLVEGSIDTGCAIFHTDILQDKLWDDPTSPKYGKKGMDGRFFGELNKTYEHEHFIIKDSFVYNAIRQNNNNVLFIFGIAFLLYISRKQRQTGKEK